MAQRSFHPLSSRMFPRPKQVTATPAPAYVALYCRQLEAAVAARLSAKADAIRMQIDSCEPGSSMTAELRRSLEAIERELVEVR